MRNNTIFIKHRVNDIKELEKLGPFTPVEIDIQLYNGVAVLAHDLNQAGPTLDSVFNLLALRFVAFNVKQEGIESHIIKLCNKFNKSDYFIFDLNFPSIAKLTSQGFKNIAIRTSDLESPQTAIKMSGSADWIWYDFFNSYEIDKTTFSSLWARNYKICLVSPELHTNYWQEDIVTNMIQQFKALLKYPDAVCTKYPERWKFKYNE
jgi:hypothetical protein